MDTSKLKRAVYPIPDDVMDQLQIHLLLEIYHRRPPYQQNDYIGWISRAKRPETREKRIHQMIDELRDGTVYMGMPYHQK